MTTGSRSRLTVTLLVTLMAGSLRAQDIPFDSSHAGDWMEGEISAVAFGFTEDKEDLLFAATRRGEILVTDLATGRELGRFQRGRRLVALAAHPNGSFVVAGDDRKNVFRWERESNNTRELARLGEDIRSIALSTDGRAVAAAGKKSVSVLDVETGAKLATLSDRRHGEDLLFVSFVDGSDSLVTLSKDKVHILWNLATQRAVRSNVEDFDEVFAADYSPSGLFAVAAVNIFARNTASISTEAGDLHQREFFGDWRDKIRLLDLKGDGQEIKVLDGQGQNEDIAFITISADNKYIATSGTKRSLKIWDILRGAEIGRLDTHQDIRDLRFSPDGQWLVAATKKGARVWRTKGIIPHPAYSALLSGDQFVYARDQPPMLDFDQLATVVLFPFSGSEGLDSEAETITTLMLDYLANGDGFQLIDRQSLNDVAEERAWQLSGMTQERAVELGKLVNADWLLRGSLQRLGPNTIMNLQLVNVETGLTDGARTVECRQCSAEDLPLAVERLARLTVK